MYIVGLDAKGAMWNPVALEPGKTVLDARNAMLRYGISRVVIARGTRPLGMVTEKDIARFLYEQVPARQLDEIRLDDIPGRAPVTVEEDADLRQCAKKMLASRISSLIVVDKKKALKGIFTKTDLTNAYVEYYALEHKVHEFMTRKVVTVAPEEPIHSAIMLMSGREISRVVAAKNGRPVGIVTGRDLLPLGGLAAGRFLRAVKNRQPFIPSGIKAAMLVSDVMTPEPITTSLNADLADAAYIMLRNRISGLPVVNSKKAIAGIVTKTDVVRALASHT